MKILENLSDQARVWVYQANRELTNYEMGNIQNKANEFVAKWAAHGTAMQAAACIFEPYHLILAVDGDVQASGCSIDSSTRFVKQIGEEIKVDFFNRLKSVIVNSEGKKSVVSFHSLKDYPNHKVYQPIVTSLFDLRNKWLIPTTELTSE